MNEEVMMRQLAYRSFPRVSDRGMVRMPVRKLRPESVSYDRYMEILKSWLLQGYFHGAANLDRGRLTDLGVETFAASFVVKVDDEPSSADCPRCVKPRHPGRCSKAAMKEKEEQVVNV